jgi:hypothetical protein
MTKGKSSNNQNGKGDSPRNNSSKQFQDNYSKIKWKSVKNKIDKNKKNKYN